MRKSKPEAHPRTVPFSEIVATVKAVARGTEELPAWAGKTVYVNEAAREFWSKPQGIEQARLAALSKLLNDNRMLLAAIQQRKPSSVAELARAIHRSDSNVSRSLGKLQRFGIVRMLGTSGRIRRPVLAADRVYLEVDVVSGRVRMGCREPALDAPAAARPKAPRAAAGK